MLKVLSPQDERQRVYRRLLSVMEHLIKLNNFSSAFALFAALCKTAVRRVVNLSSKQEKVSFVIPNMQGIYFYWSIRGLYIG